MERKQVKPTMMPFEHDKWFHWMPSILQAYYKEESITEKEKKKEHSTTKYNSDIDKHRTI